MADPTRYIPITIKLDTSQLKTFEKEALSGQAKVKASGVETATKLSQVSSAQVKQYVEGLKQVAAATEKVGPVAIKATTAAVKGLSDADKAAMRLAKTLANNVAPGMGGVASSAGQLAASMGPVGIAIAGAVIATIGLGVAAVAAEEKLYELTKTVLEEERRIGDLASKAGVTLQFFDTLKYGADQSHISTERISNSLLIFQKHLLDAGQGSDTAKRQLAAFKINQDDIAQAMNGNSEPAMRKFLNTLGQAPDDAKKMGGELKNLGRGGGDLSLVMKNLGGNVDNAMESLKRGGLVMTEEGYKKSKAFEKALNDLDRQWLSIKRTIAENAAPAITAAIELLAKTVAEKGIVISGLITVANGISKAFAYAAFFIRATALSHEYLAGQMSYEQMNDRLEEARTLRDLGTGASKEFESKIKEKKEGLLDTTKGTKSTNAKGLLDSQRAIEFARADESLRATKARLDNEDAAIRADYAEKLTSFKNYKEVETRIANEMTKAELNRNRLDFFALEDEKSELQKKAAGAKGKEIDQYKAAVNNIDAKMIELDGRYSTILGEREKKLIALNKAGVEAQKQWDDFIENQEIALAGLSGEDQKFAQAKLKNQKVYQDAIDKWQKEIDARARVTGGSGDINLGTAELASLNEVLRRSNLAVDVEENLAHIAKTKNDLSEKEKEITAAVSLGIYSQLQGRDALLAVQRQQKPLLEAELAGLEKSAKEQGKAVTPETVARIKELHNELATMGVDLQRMAEEGALKHMFDFDANHVNDSLRTFLASQKNLQQTMEDLRVNAAKSVFSIFDDQIDKMNKGLGKFGGLLSELEKDLIHMALAKLMQKAFGIQPSGAPTGGGPPSGMPGVITNFLGGGSGSGGSQAAVPASGGGGTAAVSQGLSFASSPMGKSIFSKVGKLFGGGKSDSGPGANFGDEGSLISDSLGDSSGSEGAGGWGKGKASAGGDGSDSAMASGMMAGAGILESFTNSGGKMGTVESGMMTAGMALGATPAGWALMAGAIGLGLAGKLGLYGKSDQKAIHDAIKSDPLYGGLDIKDSKIIDQIKQIGDQQWPGKVKQHVAQLIHEDQVKQLIDSFAQYDLKNNPNYQNSLLARTKHLGDINASENQFIRRANGGQIFAGVPTLMGERRAELVTPNIGGMVHRDANAALDDLSARISARMQKQGGSSSSARSDNSSNQLASALGALVEHLERLSGMSPGSILQLGAKSNPQAISSGLIEGLRGNFGHRRELNQLTGA